LRAGAHDVIFTHLPETGADLANWRLFREPLTLVVPQEHPLATETSVSVSQLTGLSVLSLSPDYALYDQIADLCRDYGAELLRDYEGTSLDALRVMVAMGMGVALLPRLYVRSELEPKEAGVVALPFRGGRVHRTLGLVWRSGTSDTRSFERLAGVVTNVARQSFTGDLVF